MLCAETPVNRGRTRRTKGRIEKCGTVLIHRTIEMSQLFLYTLPSREELAEAQMNVFQVTERKKEYLSLLLLADEQEDMLDRYLEGGVMFVLDDDGVKGECVVTNEGDGVLEIKNIAVAPGQQRKGYGKALIEYIADRYRERYSILQVGTGDSPLTIPFYEKCVFVRHHIVKNFFTYNYDHPIYECGVQLVDMVYLRRAL